MKITKKLKHKNTTESLLERKNNQIIKLELGLKNNDYPFPDEYWNIKNRNDLIHYCINHNYFF